MSSMRKQGGEFFLSSESTVSIVQVFSPAILTAGELTKRSAKH